MNPKKRLELVALSIMHTGEHVKKGTPMEAEELYFMLRRAEQDISYNLRRYNETRRKEANDGQED